MTTKVTADLERYAITAIFVGHAGPPTLRIEARKANHNHQGHSECDKYSRTWTAFTHLDLFILYV